MKPSLILFAFFACHCTYISCRTYFYIVDDLLILLPVVLQSAYRVTYMGIFHIGRAMIQ